MPEEIKLPKGYKLQEDLIGSAPVYPKGYIPYNPSGPSPTTGEELRGEVAPAAGRFAASSLPAVGGALGATVGPWSGIGGAAAGSFISNALKEQFPKIFGEPGDPLEKGLRTVSDIVSQGVVPAGVGKILSSRMGQSVIGGIPPITDFPIRSEEHTAELQSRF